MNLVEMTERALSSFNNSQFFSDDDQTNQQINGDLHHHHPINGTESPSVELVDRTGELFDHDMDVNWQSSAVYDHQNRIENETKQTDDLVWSIVDELTRKTHELLVEEPKVSTRND